MALKLKDILAGKPTLRRKEFPVPGGEPIEIREFSAKEQWTLADIENKAEGTDPAEQGRWLMQTVYPEWVVRAMKEPGEDPTPEEIEAVVNALGLSVLRDIVVAAVQFDKMSTDDARKNSPSDRTSDSDTD